MDIKHLLFRSGAAAAIRDALLMFGLGYIAGLVLGGSADLTTLMVVGAVVQTVGFAISGCFASENRFSHLRKVAAGIFGLSLITVWFELLAPSNWVLGLPFILAQMVTGGGVSMLIVRPRSAEQPVQVARFFRRLVLQAAAAVVCLVAGSIVGGSIKAAAGESAPVSTGFLQGTLFMQQLALASIPTLWFVGGRRGARILAALGCGAGVRSQ